MFMCEELDSVFSDTLHLAANASDVILRRLQEIRKRHNKTHMELVGESTKLYADIYTYKVKILAHGSTIG